MRGWAETQHQEDEIELGIIAQKSMQMFVYLPKVYWCLLLSAKTMQMTLGDCFGIPNHSFWTKLWSCSTEIIWEMYIEASWQQAMINLGRGQNDPCMAHNSKEVQKGGTYWGRVTWLGRQIKSTVCEWHVVKQFWSQGLWRNERPWDDPHNGTTKFALW